MGQPARVTAPYRVRFDESGPDGELRPSGYLRYAQDLAWLHSTGSGFGREWYDERGLTWLVRAVELEIDASAHFGQQLEVSTEVVGFRRVWARRRSEFRHAVDGQLLATALIDWVLLNRAGAPARVPPDIVAAFPAASQASFALLRIALPRVPDDAGVLQFRPRRSELDPLGHVNNAAYLDYVDEQLQSTASRYRVEFLAPAEPGITLRATSWRAGDRSYIRLDAGAGHLLAQAEVSR